MGKLTQAIRELSVNHNVGKIDLKLEEINFNFADLATSTVAIIGGDMRLEHGTSLDVMKKAVKLLERDFDLDSEDDYVRYFTKSKYTYYLIIQSAFHVSTVDCAMRVILDDLKHPKTVVIDFVRTRKKMAGRALGSQLVRFLLNICEFHASNVFVTSTKEAVSYWEKVGFEKETNEDIDYLLNEFGDCTLMSLPSNSPFELPSDYSGSEETECTATEDESSSSSEEETDSEETSSSASEEDTSDDD